MSRNENKNFYLFGDEHISSCVSGIRSCVCVCVCTDALKKMSQCCITHTHTPRVCLPEAVGNIHTLTLMYAAALKIAEQQSRRERQERNVGEGLPVLSIKNNNIIPRVRGDMCTRHV